MSEFASDSIEVETIQLTDIPSSLAQTRIKTLNILDKMLTLEELDVLAIKNDTVISEIRAKTDEIKQSSRESRSIRYLENRKMQLRAQRDRIVEVSGDLSSIISSLDKSASFFNEEKAIWNATASLLQQKHYSINMLERIDAMDNLLDSALLEINKRTEQIFFILEKSAGMAVVIDESTTEVEASILALEEELLTSKHPNIFNLNYTAENLEFRSAIKYYLNESYFDLKSYMGMHKQSLIILVVIFLFLIYIFYRNKNLLVDLKENSQNYYQQKLGQVLYQPLNAALVLTLFFSTLIFTNRPLVFRDILGYVMIFPLLIVSRQLIHKHFHFYVNAFTLLMFPILIYVLFPPENVFFRFNLVLIAISETILTGRFYFKTVKEEHVAHQLNRKLLSGIGLFFFIISVVGLFSSLWGNVMLAQIVLLTIFYAVFAGAVLYVSSIMLNGLLITYMDSDRAKKVNAFRSYSFVIKRRFSRIVNFLAGFYWLVVVLKQLKIWDDVSVTVLEFLKNDWTLGAISFSVGNILIFFVIIYLSTILSKVIQVLLEGDMLNKMKLSKGVPHSIAVMVRYTLVTAGLMLAVSAAGLTLNNLAVVVGAIGVGIGFGLQNIFNNLVSGLILLFERPVQIGDTIEIGTLMGKVKSIGIRSSNVRTFDGAEVIVPNGNLVSNEVINWTLSDQQRRIEVIVGVSYNSDPPQVIKLLTEILKEHPMILQDPSPSVYFHNLGESSLDFRMLFWTSSFSEWMRIRSEIIVTVFDVMQQNDIEIPFPQRDIHVRSIEEQLRVSKEDSPEKSAEINKQKKADGDKPD